MVREKRGKGKVGGINGFLERKARGIDKTTLYVILGILVGLLAISVYFLVQKEEPLFAPKCLDDYALISPIDANVSGDIFNDDLTFNETMAIDGDENTFWLSRNFLDYHVHNITFDLGEIKCINAAEILATWGEYFSAGINVSISEEGTSWQDVSSDLSYPSPQRSIGVFDGEVYGRYVQFFIIGGVDISVGLNEVQFNASTYLDCVVEYTWNLTTCLNDQVINYTEIVSLTPGCTISDVIIPANQTINQACCEADYYWNVTECVGDEIINYTVVDMGSITAGCGIENVTIPSNQTIVRDCDGNGLIGIFSDIDDRVIDLDELRIDNRKINYTGIYDGEEFVEIEDEDGVIRVEFNWDFDDNPLNLKGIVIEKQSSSSKYGYLIVKGINSEKTIRVDKKNSTSSKVCIRGDAEIDDEDDFSTKCTLSSEDLIDCDGDEDEGFTCTISGSYFVIGGLRNSGVKEHIYSSSLTSTTTTTTSGNTGTSSGTTTTSSGTTTTTSSIPSGTATTSSTPSGSASGDEEGSKTWLWIVIGVLIVAVLIVLFLIISVSMKKSVDREFSNVIFQQTPPSNPTMQAGFQQQRRF